MPRVRIERREIAQLTVNFNRYSRRARKAVQEAVEDTTVAVHAHAVSHVAVDRGDLKRDIDYKIGKLSGIVFAGSEEVPYAAHVEYGTSPHIIEPVDSNLLVFKNSAGEKVFATRVNHPGTAAQPFMRPAAKFGGPVLKRKLADNLRRAS